MKILFFWDMTPCNQIYVCRVFVILTFSIISAGKVMMGAVGSYVTPGKSTALPVIFWKTVIFTF
jgi:hypothetical protein